MAYQNVWKTSEQAIFGIQWHFGLQVKVEKTSTNRVDLALMSPTDKKIMALQIYLGDNYGGWAIGSMSLQGDMPMPWDDRI